MVLILCMIEFAINSITSLQYVKKNNIMRLQGGSIVLLPYQDELTTFVVMLN